MSIIKVGVLVVLASTVAVGCVTATSYDYEKTQQVNDKKVEAKSIAFTFRRTTLTSGSGRYDPDDCDAELKGSWAAPPSMGSWAAPQREDVDLHQFSTAFGKVVKAARRTFAMGDDDCDVRMDIHLQNGRNAWGLIGAFISRLTYTIVPCWGDDNYTLAVDASDKAGRKKSYQLTGSVTTVIWLPCILGMPFTGLPETRAIEITRENWDELCRRMIADGFFNLDTHAPAKTDNGKTSPWVIEQLQYVDSEKQGILVLCVNDGDFAGARTWALAYIEELVKDKNAALRTGTVRSETTYFLRDEKIEGKKLTISFETM